MNSKMVLFFTILSGSLRAQYADSHPDFFSTWFLNRSFSQAAYIPDSVKASVQVQSKNRTGPFSKIHTVAFSVDRIFRTSRNGAHAFRFLISDEKTGPYISRMNAQFNYVFQQALGEEVLVLAGISGGMMQVSYTAPSATSFGTARVPDGKAGLAFRRKNFQTGVSVLQVLNNSYKPLQGTLQLHRFYSCYISQKKELSIRSTCTVWLRYDWMPEVRNAVHATIQYTYGSVFHCAVAYGNYSGLTFFTGFTIPLRRDRLHISLANNSPFFSPSAIPVNSLEFAAGYEIR